MIPAHAADHHLRSWGQIRLEIGQGMPGTCFCNRVMRAACLSASFFANSLFFFVLSSGLSTTKLIVMPCLMRRFGLAAAAIRFV